MTMMKHILLMAFAITTLAFGGSAFAQMSLEEAISAIKKVNVNGAGHEQAVSAMKVLNSATVDQVPVILDGMEGANRLSANWFRSAVISVVGRSKGGIPVEKVKAYFENKGGSQLGRLLAFDLLSESDESWAAKTIPSLIDDPSLPLRRKAVDNLLSKAKDATTAEALGALSIAFANAREADQVIKIAERLDDRGVAVDVQKQLGFIHTWNLVGCFDNKDQKGFDVAYGPEKALEKVDLEATYTSMDESETKWQVHTTADPTGLVDLNEVMGKIKGATVYATAVFKAEEARDCEIRVGCINAHKVWVNGDLVMSNEIYHNSISPDKFSAPATLKEGDNQILIKVCQNEQTQPWAQRWLFQLRVCDETGKAIAPAKPAPSRN